MSVDVIYSSGKKEVLYLRSNLYTLRLQLHVVLYKIALKQPEVGCEFWMDYAMSKLHFMQTKRNRQTIKIDFPCRRIRATS